MLGGSGACVPGRQVPPAWVHHQGPDTQLPIVPEGAQQDEGQTPWPLHAQSWAGGTFQVQSIVEPP